MAWHGLMATRCHLFNWLVTDGAHNWAHCTACRADGRSKNKRGSYPPSGKQLPRRVQFSLPNKCCPRGGKYSHRRGAREEETFPRMSAIPINRDPALGNAGTLQICLE